MKRKIYVESVMCCFLLEKKLEEAVFHPGRQHSQLLQIWDSEETFSFFFVFPVSFCVTVVFVWPCLNWAYVCHRIRSLSELFHWETFRRSMNVSSSQGESTANHWVKLSHTFTFSASAYLHYLMWMWRNANIWFPYEQITHQYKQHLQCGSWNYIYLPLRVVAV